MKLINTALFAPRNLVIVAAIAVVAHILAMPLFAAIDGDGGSN